MCRSDRTRAGDVRTGTGDFSRCTAPEARTCVVAGLAPAGLTPDEPFALPSLRGLRSSDLFMDITSEVELLKGETLLAILSDAR